jgi:decaprenylphospho-beta-D-ribofuranose 2-oxidase
VADAISAVGPRGLIGRGCGRSYGDVSTNHGGRVVDMTALNAIEQFDADSGNIVCEAGVTMRELVERHLAEGYVPPVCPGTGYVTVAGAVAHDVHGKNHALHGSFGDHVEWLDLLLPSGEVRRVSQEQHPELLQATIGGAGLTGLIIRVKFRMLYIGTNAVKLYEQRMDSLDQFMEALKIADLQSTYSVGWVDALARGPRLGRGILMTAEPADSFMPVRKRRSITVPLNLPRGTLNRLSVGAFNACYFRRIGREHRSHVDFARFVFPLDALLHWNRLYGSRGVFQFQCVIPHDRAPTAIRELLVLSADRGAASPLDVIKTFGRQGRGYLSFPMPGFTLALDFPRTTGSTELIRRMHEITLSNGGRVYLAKDACLQAEEFQRMYPSASLFRKVLDEIDPGQVMQSDMARRLSMRAEPGGAP